MAKQSTNSTRSSNKRGASNRKNDITTSFSFLKPFGLGVFFGVLLCLGLQWLISKEPRTVETAPTQEATAPKTPELNFYETLPNAEVVVSEEAIAYEAAKVNYILQAGSFRQAEDADTLRVQLILMNLEAEIQTVGQSDNIWHRVVIGPFTERSATAKARSTLLENGIESLLLTLPAEN